MSPKVVILCGGVGTRLKEQTEHIPKPLVRIGERPILWHLMKIYSYYGFKEFVLCLGYKGELIKEYFINYPEVESDFTFNIKTRHIEYHNKIGEEDWKITFAETGKETETGGRVLKAAKYFGNDDYFLLTYADGVADIDINKVISFHNEMGKMITLAGVRTRSKYGQLKVDEKSLAFDYEQKPHLQDTVNGGFMVVNKRFINYLKDKPIEDPFKSLAKQGEIAVYRHPGVFYSMDTQRDVDELNEIWKSGNAPWKIWG